MKPFKKALLSFAFISIFPVCIYSGNPDSLTVTGTVFDSSGDPLVGVTIVQDGTSNGTVSDQDGTYTIQCNGPKVQGPGYKGYKVVASMIGYETNIAIVPGALGSTVEHIIIMHEDTN